ncbi:hypothetical protein CPLU01_06207 [Colletotrichum plurivorum]|uniref:Uncharacterized protein n=1 Tax=Colletotrichum plurivorum TaxID=2175906 RepID=A0A8H6NG61_9PEZI|nr:hypothetical protein CPLU01_06207 [Colletotrichum plurivorum]
MKYLKTGANTHIATRWLSAALFASPSIAPSFNAPSTLSSLRSQTPKRGGACLSSVASDEDKRSGIIAGRFPGCGYARVSARDRSLPCDSARSNRDNITGEAGGGGRHPGPESTRSPEPCSNQPLRLLLLLGTETLTMRPKDLAKVAPVKSPP